LKSPGRDWLAIESIVLRQVEALDPDTIWRELIPLLELKRDPEAEPRLRRLLTQGGQTWHQ